MSVPRFKVPTMLPFVALLIMAFAMPRIASAQLSVGGYVGAEFDNQDHWLLYGGEVRLPLQSVIQQPLDANIRYSYHSYGSGASFSQVDFNALHNWDLAHPGPLAPYVGLGAAWAHYSFGGTSDNKIGLNLISGTKLNLSKDSRVQPFMHMQYTIIRDYPNSYTLSVGLSFRLGQSAGK